MMVAPDTNCSAMVVQPQSQSQQSHGCGSQDMQIRSYCNKMGHICDTCWQLHGRPSGYGRDGHQGRGRFGIAIDHHQANLSKHKEKGVSSTKASTPPSPVNAGSSLSTDEMLHRIIDRLNVPSGSAPSTNGLPSKSFSSPSIFYSHFAQSNLSHIRSSALTLDTFTNKM